MSDPRKVITLPIKCSTVKWAWKKSVVIMALLIWIAFGWMFNTWINIQPTSTRSIDGFISIVVFLIVAMSYTWFCAVPQLPKFQCIKDEEPKC